MHSQFRKMACEIHYSSPTFSLYLYCAGKQQKSYFRNEAIKQSQNEHSPLVNQHMAMSFACLWITNLRGELLQMEFSMPCALCFIHCKQTKSSWVQGLFDCPSFAWNNLCVFLSMIKWPAERQENLKGSQTDRNTIDESGPFFFFNNQNVYKYK